MVRDNSLISSPRKSPNFYAKNWNLIVFAIGMFCFNIDLFFLYLPKECGSASICMDLKLGVVIAIIRTLADVSFLCAKSVLPYKSHTLEASVRSKPVREQRTCVRCNRKMKFILDLAIIIPLPQVLIWRKIHASDASMTSDISRLITLVLLVQLSFRAIAMLPVSQNISKMTGTLMKNAWSGALINLMYFMVVSHIWGALYYHMLVLQLLECKHIVFDTNADARTLDWDQLVAACTQNVKFDMGMFSDGFTTKISRRSFAQKYVYCLSWGLKSLSSFGQIFSASSDPVDTIFSFLSVIFGLILFGDLLARMQSGLQSTEIREGRQRTRQRMVEEWMAYHQLPKGLKRQVKQAIQAEWSAHRGLNDEVILDSLPWDVKHDVRRHLYLDIIRSLPPFEEMDDHLMKEICGKLRTFSRDEGTYIELEGGPVRQMIFIFSGQLEVCSGNSGGYSMTLGPGEFCGRELLEWCSNPTKSTEDLPSSTHTIKCITNVDAFSLLADEVKLLAIQFHRDGRFRHAFQRYAP